MEQLTRDLAENQKKLDELLGVGRNYDVISRDLYRSGIPEREVSIAVLYK